MSNISERVATIETDVRWIRESMEQGHTCVSNGRLVYLETWNKIYKRVLIGGFGLTITITGVLYRLGVIRVAL